MAATLKELGRQLKEAREGRKLSMQEASEITKISKRILTAFEQADCDHFPHPVYAKGFIKNYAKLLGLDSEEFGRAMGQALGESKDASEIVTECPAAPDPLRDRSVAKGQGKRTWPTVLLLLFFIVLLGVLVWYLLISPSGQPVPEAAPHETTAAQSAPASEPAQAEAVPAEITPVPAEPAPVPVETTVEAGADAQAEPDAPAVQAENQLRIKSRDQEGSWVGIYDNDGETLLRDFTVSGAGEMNLELAQPRSLRIGRVQGVEVWFGGRQLELEGVGTRNVKLPPAQ